MTFLSNSHKKIPPISHSEINKLPPGDVIAITKAVSSGKRLRDVIDGVEVLYETPIAAGIVPGNPGVITDEDWAAGATRLSKKYGLTRFFIRMVALLRAELKGKPYRPMPLANEPCPCRSHKKYSDCCGAGIEESDPPECKKGNHAYQAWKMTEKGRMLRGCWNCTMIEEAPWAADTEINGQRAVLIGCKYCGAHPDIDDAIKLIKECEKYDLCGVCGKAIGFKSVHVQHKYQDGLHIPEWTISEADWNPLIDFSSEAMQTPEGAKGISIHDACLKKAFPHWDKLTNDKYANGRIEQFSFLRMVTKEDPNKENNSSNPA